MSRQRGTPRSGPAAAPPARAKHPPASASRPGHVSATAPPVDDDGRDALELSATENADLCAGCVKCCTYITVEVDSPRTPREYDQWLWAIMHRQVSLYVERPEKWFIAFETPCENLGRDGRCGIYGRHPVLCREYDPRHCERRLPLTDIRAWFDTADQFEDWIRRERPVHYRALMAWRKDSPDAPPRADVVADRRARAAAALVTIGEPAAKRPRPAEPVLARSGGRGSLKLR
jgi:uncharacterized protein